MSSILDLRARPRKTSSILYGAREFLLEVFAHRIRSREQYVESFRLSSLDLPGRATGESPQDGARFLSDRRLKPAE